MRFQIQRNIWSFEDAQPYNFGFWKLSPSPSRSRQTYIVKGMKQKAVNKNFRNITL